MSTEAKRQLIDPAHGSISLTRQCELVGLARSCYYYEPAGVDAMELELMRLLDRQYTRRPYYGVARMTHWLNATCGYQVNCKRVRRLLRQMGLQAIYPRPRLSQPSDGHRIYPYLLREVSIECADHVWSTDITYIPMQRGFVYLVAVIDWWSRYVLSWRLSVNLDTQFCLEALDEALAQGTPRIFNTDQGSQFTSREFTSRLQEAGIAISMDGRGRALDNVFVERLWRSVKYEEVYLNEYTSVEQVRSRLKAYFEFYNHERPHQGLDYSVPAHRYGVRQSGCGNGALMDSPWKTP